MTIRATIDDGFTPVLGKLRTIVREPYGGNRGERVRRSAQRTLRTQFERGGYFSASGFVAWTPTRAFGTKPATVPTLGGPSSSLGRAAAGGAGGAWATGPKKVQLTITLPYWDVHDEGARIGVTPKMRGFVGVTFGVQFRADKTHVVIPQRRLIDSRAPEFAKLARDIVVKEIGRVAG